MIVVIHDNNGFHLLLLRKDTIYAKIHLTLFQRQLWSERLIVLYPKSLDLRINEVSHLKKYFYLF